ncbi:type VI secretion system protein TssA [Herbaspirillum sp. RV1423]|uniref:type VI secretion system protein TssA n=1 Tax=Herbaspirillum sp. RV1423 TaxID=1443993 RepID=UPI0004B101CE|nr:type VI secretion system protein TssA [Herbaspirillum sp. RV1423]
MMTKLLNALFGSRTPTDLARSTQARWDDWLQPISADSPAGGDLAYDDDFLAIKDEVAKLSDIDDVLIVNGAERLLKHSAKDVRPAVYYVYGRLRQEGAEGLASGLELLSALIDRFGEQLLPQRAESRKVALEWLTGATFANRLERVQGLEGVLLERSLSALALITERTASWPEAARPELDGLYRRFESCIEHAQVIESTLSAVSAPSAPGVNAAILPATGEVSSSRDLLERARQMALFLREQPHGYLAAYRLLRCVRWDTLIDVPPHDISGKSRLVAPRTELRAQLKRLLLQKQWPELLDRVEQAFAEGANHFWLDLQYYAHTAQEHGGGDYAQARDLAATDCALMLERLPGVERLSFTDGTPFAEDVTLEWITRYATVRDIERGDTVAPVVIAASHTDWAETEAQAFDVLQRQGLEAALAWLQGLPAQKGERDSFIRQLVMARVAERAERQDTALHLLTVADDSARRYTLGAWEPGLAFEVKQHLLRLLTLRMNRKDADKVAVARRMDSLLGELTALDPARAVGLA